jgi:branched-subunit amino acid aminotransferase/4-amino-4-deoxychorismate lyase
MSEYLVQRNGRAATGAELAPLAFAGYAHFTAMQVRGRRVRGLDLHVARLRAASERMFGRALPDDRMLSYLRAAVQAGPPDVSLAAFVYPAPGEFTAAAGELDVLVRTGPSADGPAGPLALATFEHERFLPEVKQTGEPAKTYALRQAAAAGFDDAVFVDRHGRFSEATIWNLAFWDGTAVLWPRAGILAGTTMGIVRRQLDRLGVPQRIEPITPADVAGLSGAVVMNSWTPGVAVRRIGTATVAPAPEFVDLLHEAYHREPRIEL